MRLEDIFIVLPARGNACALDDNQLSRALNAISRFLRYALSTNTPTPVLRFAQGPNAVVYHAVSVT